MDFTVLEENIDFSWDDYMPACIRTLESYGFEVEIGSKPEYDIGEIRRRYVKIPCYDIAKEYLSSQIWAIKIIVSIIIIRIPRENIIF